MKNLYTNNPAKQLIILGIIAAFVFTALSPLAASANDGRGKDDHGAKASAKVEAKIDKHNDKDDNERGEGHGNNWKRLFTFGWWKKNHDNGTSTPPNPQNAAPRITDHSVARATSTATISFKTNESTTAELRYSTSSVAVASSSWVVMSGTMNTMHSFPLTGLVPDTKYFYVLIVKDAQGMVKQTAVESFSTKPITTVDATAPVIYFSASVDVKANAANIIWTTNEQTNGRLWISTTNPAPTTGTPNRTDSGMSYFHNLRVDSLAANTQYFYGVSSTDKAGNVSTTATGSFFTPSM